MEEIEEFWEGIRPDPLVPTQEAVLEEVAASFRIGLQPLIGSPVTREGRVSGVSTDTVIHQMVEDYYQHEVVVNQQVIGASVGVSHIPNTAESLTLVPELTLEAAREFVHSPTFFDRGIAPSLASADLPPITRLNAENVARLERAFDDLGLPTHIEFQRATRQGEPDLLQIDLLGPQLYGTGIETTSSNTRINLLIPV